jgi:hypothetical protein
MGNERSKKQVVESRGTKCFHEEGQGQDEIMWAPQTAKLEFPWHKLGKEWAKRRVPHCNLGATFALELHLPCRKPELESPKHPRSEIRLKHNLTYPATVSEISTTSKQES